MPSHVSNWADCIEHAELSDIGMRRQNNQDSLSAMPAADEASWRERGHLFMVADGMGAHAAGELASKLACDGIPHNYSKMLEIDPVVSLQRAILGANVEIHTRGLAEAGFHGMGTTCSVLLLLPEGAIVGHVGDSRVYRLRDEWLEQLTFDHSLVWEMRASGQLPGAAASLPKNIITRSLGPHPSVAVDLEGPFAVRRGDTFLLCSDGLSGPINDREIGTILHAMPPAEAAQVLIDLANLRGGPDNISVVIIRVLEPPVATEVEPEPDTSNKWPLVQPVAWIAAALSLGAAVAMIAMGLLIPAAAAGLCATVALIVALSQRQSADQSDPDAVIPRAPLGRGPYVRVDCTASHETVDELANVAAQLREAAKEQLWRVDWDHFERLRDEADQEAAAGKYAAAVRAHGLSISLVIDDLRRRRGELKSPSDSNVDLV